ncbi:histidine kinase [Streptomyces mayteni]
MHGRVGDDGALTLLRVLAGLDRRPAPRRSPVDLGRLAAEPDADLRARQPDRPVRVAVPAAAGPVTVWGDEAMLRQLVGNLLGNVGVHTPAGARRDGRPVVRAREGPDGDRRAARRRGAAMRERRGGVTMGRPERSARVPGGQPWLRSCTTAPWRSKD